MNAKDLIIARCRDNVTERYPMPDLDDIHRTVYPDPLAKFIEVSKQQGCKVVELKPGQDISKAIAEAFPNAKKIASNLPDITIANINPDTVARPQDLDGTDLGIIRGTVGVAENGCVWIEQTMKQRAVCFISEELAILVPADAIVSNMHQAYRHVTFNSYGFGCFISGPSKTADIAQVLVMGAQAARAVTLFIINN